MARMLRAIVIVVVLIFCLVLADKGQEDCQPNEVFVTCGHCEATCDRPTTPGCDPICRSARCECVQAKGFVRSRHGHCIPRAMCADPPSIYSEDPYRDLRPHARVTAEGSGGFLVDTVGRGKPSLFMHKTAKTDVFSSLLNGEEGGTRRFGRVLRRFHRA